MKKPIKTGLLSFGMSGKVFHSPFLDTHENFELTAIVERSEKKASQFYPNLKSYDTIYEILADPTIELIVVNTPNATHFDFTLQALQAGKHVLLEKPVTTTSAQAKRLYEEATKHNRCLLPYQNRRFDSDFLSVKKIIDSGKLGRLAEVHFRYDRFRDTIGPKVAKEVPGPGSGLMWDLGPHLLDQAISVFGKPLKWTKTLGHFRKNTQVDDYVNFHLEYADELQVFLTTSMLVADAQAAFVVHGTKGSFIKQRADVQEKQLIDGISPENSSFGMEASGKEGILTTVSPDGSFFQERVVSEKSSYLNLFDSIYKTIREGKAYPITEEQIISQLEILEEEY